jgi:hypothetical protein
MVTTEETTRWHECWGQNMPPWPNFMVEHDDGGGGDDDTLTLRKNEVHLFSFLFHEYYVFIFLCPLSSNLFS